jgi:hypothetical protein
MLQGNISVDWVSILLKHQVVSSLDCHLLSNFHGAKILQHCRVHARCVSFWLNKHWRSGADAMQGATFSHPSCCPALHFGHHPYRLGRFVGDLLGRVSKNGQL